MLQHKLKEVESDIKSIERSICELQCKKKELLSFQEKLKNDIEDEKSVLLANKDWRRQDCEWSESLFRSLKESFKITELRPQQLPAMNATLSGTDCILIMPTGGGKSLCYQLPALISKGITIVVSPLVSLMEDQIMGLEKLNIPATFLSANSTKEEVNAVYKAMTDPTNELKLLYVTPEKLSKSKRFMSKLQRMHQMKRFARLAIDEVHCCSHWGHDFRPDYKFLGIMRQMFLGTPIIGLTATATARVIADVQKILNIKGCLILRASFNRPNLFYEVRPKPATHQGCIEELAKLLNNDFKDLSGIIYTMTIKETEELSRDLCSHGIKAAPYHASLDASLRSKIHRKWVKNIYQVVVATIAFGMGIDKPDVRFVIHHCISKSMENFYQESGRAGRDDQPAKCILYWRFPDFSRQSTMVFTEHTGLDNLYGLIKYCLDSHRCRRELIAEHFNEKWSSSDCDKMCDNCSHLREVQILDLTKYGKQIEILIKNAVTHETRLTGTKLIDAWLGKGPTNLRVKEATASHFSREKAEAIVAHLLVDGFLREDFHFTPYSTISYIVAGQKLEVGLTPSPMEIVTKEIDSKSNWKLTTEASKKRKMEDNDKNDRKKPRLVVTINDDSD